MIPAQLQARHQWIVWALKDGKKPPVDDKGHAAKDWRTMGATFADAQLRLLQLPIEDAEPGAHPTKGLGLLEATGADLDDCFDQDGELLPSARMLLDSLPGYAERSPSRKGLKIFFRTDPSFWVEFNFHGGNADVTAERKAPLYFTVTGHELRPGDPDADGTASVLESLRFYQGQDNSPGHVKKGLEDTVRPGSQNQEAFREACRYVRMGKTEEEIVGMLWAQRDRFPTEPGREAWTESDFRQLARSATRYKPSADPFAYDNRGDGSHFTHLHGDTVRFDHLRQRWLIYDGRRWEPDPTEKLREYAEQSARSRKVNAALIQDATAAKVAARWTADGSGTRKIDYCLREARSMPPIASAGLEWDTDPWLLGVRNGVLDLRTGTLRPGRPEDGITMQTAVGFKADAQAPLWEVTLEDVFKDKPPGFVEYVQRALGYSLTGDMREEVFFLLTGTGRNGKGTVINTFAEVLGDYAADLKFASLEVNRNAPAGAGPSPDFKKLEKKRFVTASEGTGGALNTSVIKQITGRDAMTARGLYEREERTYKPELKLWLTAQSEKRPKVRDDSDGFWARPHEVQFAQSYVDRQDKTLKDRLLGELEGILAWAVRGCLEWQRVGLAPPAEVLAAVEEYRRSEEPLAEFYQGACEIRPGLFVTRTELRDAYVRWAERERIHFRLGPKRFAQEVAKRFPSVRPTGATGEDRARGHEGIGLQHTYQGTTDTREPGQDDVPF
jgi:P4 family phage/plasmid primase-like protien